MFFRCLIITFLLLAPMGGRANGLCDLETALASYQSALQKKKLGDDEAAFRLFLPLAQAAIAPAQRHVAEYYQEESRDQFALEKAIMWSQLAAWGGDEAGQALRKETVESARHAVSEAGLKWAADWRPTDQACYGSEQIQEADDDFKTVGHFPVIRHEGVSEDQFDLFVGRLYEAVLINKDVAPYFRTLIDLIPAFEVVAPTSGTDRYIGWDAENGWVQVSAGFLDDETARQLSYSLVLVVQRYLFDQIQDATFVDQISTHWGKVKIFGSLYGDVHTPLYLELMLGAVKKIRQLPVALRDKANTIDEIYYMPPSRYHFSRFTRTKQFAFYDYKRSRAGKRIAVVAQRMGFETVDQLVSELVRLGSQVQQHVRIENMKSQLGGKKREDAFLKALEGDPKEVMKMLSKRNQAEKEMIDDWSERGPDGIVKLYCEAAFEQVRAAIALKMPDHQFSRFVDLRGCKKAKKAWSDHRKGATQK